MQFIHDKNNIHITAYGSLYKINDTIENIARKLQVSPQQVLLKWTINKNIHVIPTSDNPEFIKDNITLNFTIADDDIIKMDNLNENFSLYEKYL